MTGTSGRSQLEGMAALGKTKVGKQLLAPKGFGVVTTLFADMRRHFGGTWFRDGETQESLRVRAERWAGALARFESRIVEDVMSDLIANGDIKAPDLKTFIGMCELKVGKERSVDRSQSLSLKRQRMADIRSILQAGGAGNG